MNYIKKLSLLLASFLVMFCCLLNVKADNTQGSGTTAPGSGGSNIKSPATGLVTSLGDGFVYGIRISAYEYDGKTIKKVGSKSIDVLPKEYYTNVKNGGVRRTSVISKLDYIKNGVSISVNSFTLSGSSTKTTNLYSTTNAFNSWKWLDNNRIFGKGAKTGFRDAFKKYISTEKNRKDLLKKLGASDEQIEKLLCDRVYFIVEPLTVIYYKGSGKGNRYMGTAYELSIFSGIKSLQPKISHDLPFSLYVTGVAKGDDKDKSGFIGNYVKTVKYTSKDNVSATSVRARNGYGMNIFWLGSTGCTNKKSQCDINNKEHFKDKNGDGKFDSGPNGEDCCEVFKNDERLLELHPECAKCTDDEITKDITGAICDDNSNVASFSDGITDIENSRCLAYTPPEDGLAEETESDKYYEKMKINDYCSIVCIENVQISLPNKPNLIEGLGYFVWPVDLSNSSIFGNNILSVSGNRTCKIMIKSESLKKASNVDKNAILNSCALKNTNIKVSSLYNLNPDIKANYNINYNGDVSNIYKSGSTTLDVAEEKCTLEYNDNSDVDGSISCSSSLRKPSINLDPDFDKAVSQVRNLRIYVSKDMNYILPKTYNAYINKSSGEPENSKKCDKQNCFEIGFGNIPLKQFDNNLKIRNTYNGEVSIEYSNIGHISSGGKARFNDDYSYTCPINSDNNFKDCNPEEEDCAKTVCDPASGDECYYCPACDVSKNATCGMDITDCVKSYYENNVKEDDSDDKKDSIIKDGIKRCQLLNCTPNNGRTVIYRVIDLDNPFPGISGINRFPGLNWSIDSDMNDSYSNNVEKYITNNRGVTTTKVYDKKPMYTFKLDKETIKNIRNYNKQNKKYDDFNLNCDNDGRNCISSAIREEGFGLDVENSVCADSKSFTKCQYEG